MDNRIFKVNGSGLMRLAETLELVFNQEGSNTTAKGWKETEEDGLILCWVYGDGMHRFPAPMSAAQCADMAMSWLQSEASKNIKLSSWCQDQDHDGHNGAGWLVYCGDWGHVGAEHYSICAIKPCWMWYGK